MSINRRSVTGILFILPSLMGITVFLIAPFAQSIYYTFTQGITDVEFVWFKNFTELFANPAFALAVKNTAIFMCVGVPLLFITGLALSLMMMNRQFIFERWALLAPLIVPIASVVFGWRFLLSDTGFVNGALSTLGFQTVEFFGEEYAMFIIILIFIWKNLGYMVVIFTSAISVLPRDYIEVFRLESKSGVKLAAQVILPNIAPMAFFAFIIAIMNSFRVFREVYVMYGNNPPKSIYMLQHFMNNNFFKLNYQRLSAAAFLVAVFIFALIWAFIKTQKRLTKDL